MIRKFIVGIAILGADYASDTRMTAPGAVRLVLDSMRQAFRHVPARRKRNCADRTCADTTAHSASRTRIEVERLAGCVQLYFEQQRRAKSDPWAVLRMHNDAEDTWPSDSCSLAQLDKVERAPAGHKWMHDRIVERGFAQRSRNSAFDQFACEVVERVIAREPSRMTLGVTLERLPKRAAAVAQHHDRTGRWIDS